MTDGEGSRRRVSRLFVWGCGEDYQLGLARATRELDFAVHQPTEIPRESFFDDDTGVNDVNDDDFQRYLSPLHHLLNRQFQPKKQINIETINGVPAAESEFVDNLRISFDVMIDFKKGEQLV